MPRDLEDEIFGGGESDLSDFDQDENRPAEIHERLGEEGEEEEEDRRDQDYDGGSMNDGAPIREGSQPGGGYPKFRKDRNHRPSEESSAARKKPQNRNKRPDPNDNNLPADFGAEEEVTIDPEEQRRQNLYQQIDEAAGKNKKGKRRKRKGGDEDLEMMADEEVSRLRTRMLKAVDEDNQANEERRPATSKLMLLPIVKSTMQKSHLETAILDNGVLEAVKKWLEPLPDRSLPAINIQRPLLDLLTKMTIDTQSLKASELGKIVLFYSKCPRVDPEIKRMADKLVTEWMRPILHRSTSRRSQGYIPAGSGMPRATRPTGAVGGRNSQRARIPETVQQVFQVSAQSQLDNPSDNQSGSQNPAMRNSTQKATAKKTREWARKLQEAKKSQRMG
ncbi:hypothetical protein MJO28_015731 [Puccinia striiformis f. sp. tritici]|uniref:TFIIS N-terminal domain-containing protein n=3 Tax=Puccinia striiformis TaxID=27350 RepID=A0A0L0V9X2_9BASI|nr:hypothetical protein Pst134EA_029293 [Puccinia striiformis f. sp. tritici]KAI9623977.1 hypothetical protein KEM48_009204 [Puccinia striiformis f. sp. tritici PST-130]KNE95981.1 hypothetical protein PSTG_10672 [Puccinia striiformis f. sp. tritici PST-78]POW23192.1 hypothetical protein PSHT_00463 [Puccinia striiformis]KAH9441292.1 hypothetical protein Pst134EB_029954 [Puccinia striiformis f. sp. tritici]KAH9447259.1 hypothetical protein Pst134EA_029293 [Puccinia striiformis f. sp. tritici]